MTSHRATGPRERRLDKTLDRSIVLGYTNLGYLARRRRWGAAAPSGSLEGRRVLVTGAGSGLGEATALSLAARGATVHLLGRTTERVEPAMELERIRARVEAAGRPGRLHAEACDVSNLDEVRWFARRFMGRLDEDGSALDVLVHNAGTMPARRETSADGHELTIATHVLGPILMTELLRPVLRRSAHGARVVQVSSGGMYTQPLPVDDPDYVGSTYRGPVAYARSKRVQVELTPLLADRLAADGVAVHAMHPGWADTPGVASSLPVFRLLTRPLLRTAEQGADTIVWLAASEPPPPSGMFWHDRASRPFSYRDATTSTDAERAALWDWVFTSIGVERDH
ncbi:SDR family NAD(P)-dependent oxidoreductase [Nocardioides humilatus]|uniref:SDR family NAD(P)-dependent oxidoreductase n=1 Tax=Nocardioides humilatus TaxID=2607660 RepID=A0A5B1LKG4_9ACTN|nr:SDR family NAD(P)-dependent oxidoreductase [Nocardioides humilatus]KAA1420964.1 SDR family NAD(P)-dependent oxidoreductase [Nocardioides humilatus]